MAWNLKTVKPAPKKALVLTIRVDLLPTGHGPRRLPRGGVHASARHPRRAVAKRQLARQLSDS